MGLASHITASQISRHSSVIDFINALILSETLSAQKERATTRRLSLLHPRRMLSQIWSVQCVFPVYVNSCSPFPYLFRLVPLNGGEDLAFVSNADCTQQHGIHNVNTFATSKAPTQNHSPKQLYNLKLVLECKVYTHCNAIFWSQTSSIRSTSVSTIIGFCFPWGILPLCCFFE